jgi:quinol-cytochrome oxidoreductase complex cytochrome b subunit
VGVVGFGVGGLFLLLIPFLDRRTPRGEPSRLFTWIGIAIMLYMVVLTYLGYTVSPTK